MGRGGQARKISKIDQTPAAVSLYANAYSCWLIMLCAANHEYPRVDKGVYWLLARFAILPPDFEPSTRRLFQAAADGDLEEARRLATRIHHEVGASVNEAGA